MTKEMKRSWLVQRLEKPRVRGGILGASNPFAFGGGLRNGGLSDEAFSLVSQIMAFDYMGAAEFEFGALPEALGRIAKAAHKRPRKSGLTAFSFSIDLANVEPHWRDRNAKAPEGSADIFVLCHKEHVGEVEKRIREWAAKDHTMKESTYLPRTLRPFDEWDGRTVGWLELNNGFFFFTEREMWEQTCALFAVEVPSQAVA